MKAAKNELLIWGVMILQALPIPLSLISILGSLISLANMGMTAELYSPWTAVCAVEADSDDYIFDFVEEAIRRDIRTPCGLQPVDHDTYERKWNQFCDDYFAQRENKE